MTIYSVYPNENYKREWGAIQILPVPCITTYRGCTVHLIKAGKLKKIKYIL